MYLGDLKSAPLLGVGISDFIADETLTSTLEMKIREHLKRDGATVKRLEFYSEKIRIDAHYTP